MGSGPLRTLKLKPPLNKFPQNLPAHLSRVPSMMSQLERRLLFGLTKDYYKGSGVIIDAGIFLGASTCCFGEGVRANARHDAIRTRWEKPILSFERAIVASGMLSFFERNKIKVEAVPGASFERILRKNIDAIADLVSLSIGDILETPNIGSPIEILFLDVLKLPEIGEFVVRQYFPLLLPGAIVIQQDYFIDTLPFIKADQEYFCDEFEYIGEVGSTAIFRCIKPVSAEKIDKYFKEPLGVDDQIRLASIALQRSTDPARRFLMALSKLRVVRKCLGMDAALAYLSHIGHEYPEQLALGYPRLHNAWRAAQMLVAAKAPHFDHIDEGRDDEADLAEAAELVERPAKQKMLLNGR